MSRNSTHPLRPQDSFPKESWIAYANELVDIIKAQIRASEHRDAYVDRLETEYLVYASSGSIGGKDADCDCRMCEGMRKRACEALERIKEASR